MQTDQIVKLDREHPDFPARALEISPPILSLDVHGQKDLLSRPCVAFVGSRRCTEYGKRMTFSLVEQLVAAGITIVSGLAYGIDSHAHRAAIEAGGKTIAVLASGIKAPLPTWQANLTQDILQSGGLVISEQPATKPALPHHFLLRNRIIAGLALGTVVVEAAHKSGALVTANYALEANRTVFAVPGDTERLTSVGANRLIRQGAVLVRSGRDILQELDPQLPGQAQSLFKLEEELLQRARKPQSMKDLMTAIKLEQKDLVPLLTRLELDGSLVQQLDGKYVTAM